MAATAQQFRALVESGDFDSARAMLAENPRRWFNEREGEGMEWRIEPGTGPWAKWDDHFQGQSEEVEWRAEDHAAVLVYRETNDYFRLLERGWVTNENVYYIDADGKISGLLIRGTGERPPGRTDEFLAWARDNEPDELRYLMPDGEVDPSGDRPERFRAILNRWRRSAGLPTIEAPPSE